MNYKLYICLILLLAMPNISLARKNFNRLLPKTISLEVNHPSTQNFSITFTNSLDKSLLFKNCNFDCKCLELLSFSKNNKKCGSSNIELAPNDFLKVTFKVDSKYYSKPKVLPVYFFFNNLVPAVQIVKIAADFKSCIIPQPESLACIVPQGFKGKIGTFKLKSEIKNLKINSIKSNSDFINANFNPENNAIDVFILKPATVNTDAWLNVSLTQNPQKKNEDLLPNSAQKSLLLNIREIKIIPDLYAVPSTMDFGVISEPGEIVGKEVVIKSRTDSPWKIIGSHIKGRNANSIKRKTLSQTNDAVNVIWAILDGKVLPGLINTEIIINTDHPFSKQIVIPVKGQVLALKKKPEKLKKPENSKISKKVIK